MTEAPRDVPLAALLALEERARRTADATELGFVMVNETRSLVRYRQAVLFTGDEGLVAVSGVSGLDRSGPCALWLTRLLRRLADQPAHGLSADALDGSDRDEWSEWLPAHAALIPLPAPDGDRIGSLLFARESPWRAADLWMLERVAEIYGMAWAWRHRPGPGARIRRALRRVPRWRWLAALLLAGLMALPVRLSVLAPAEVVARDPAVVRAPLDGVVRRVLARPNETVTAGQVLFELDRTSLSGQLEIARKSLSTGRAQFERATQQAFADARAKAELAVLRSRVEERQAEVARLADQLERCSVTAPRDGTAVLDAPSEWIGRPVSVGERVLSVADPGDTEVEAWLAPHDMIALAPGAPVTLFLNTDPLNPVAARLRYVAYAATLRPDGLLAHRARADIADHAERPRLGLKGTARLDGRSVPLAYWLFRKPLSVARRTLGL